VQMVHAPLQREFDNSYEPDLLDDESKSPVYVP